MIRLTFISVLNDKYCLIKRSLSTNVENSIGVKRAK